MQMGTGQCKRSAGLRSHVIQQEERLYTSKLIFRAAPEIDMPVQAIKSPLALVRRRQQELGFLALGCTFSGKLRNEIDQLWSCQRLM